MIDLSIIIPLYKSTKQQILPLISSYANQYFLEENNLTIELLFMTDDTFSEKDIVDFIKEILGDYKCYDLKFHHCLNTSSGYKRNLGIEIANGKYVWFNDQDDWLTNQVSLINIIKYLRNNPNKQHIVILPNKIDEIPDAIVRPWMHILDKQFAKQFKFAEDKEWGADAEFILPLLQYEKVEYNETTKKYIITWNLKDIYTWNNINPNSFSVSQIFKNQYEGNFKPNFMI